MRLIDPEKRNISIKTLTWVLISALLLNLFLKCRREIHNNVSELPAVCHSCNLSFGYSHSLSVVL